VAVIGIVLAAKADVIIMLAAARLVTIAEVAFIVTELLAAAIA
tara:strand:- start:10 stop:138 length:129 start_codon:yes stop_codon:yes gene_type:complete